MADISFHGRNLCQLSSHENVEIRLYNPINLLTPWKINYRMHDKYLIADDFAYILGGRNTDNRFLGNYQEHYNVDRDILVYETEPGAGQSYQQLMNYFEAVWALPCCKVLKIQGVKAIWLAVMSRPPNVTRKSLQTV